MEVKNQIHRLQIGPNNVLVLVSEMQKSAQ